MNSKSKSSKQIIVQEPDRYHFEKQLWSEGYKRVMGLDEVGRGCLCGPVVAAGVILRPGAQVHNTLRDSKMILKEERSMLAELIKEEALFWTIQWCSPEVIDRLNILNASLHAMIKCSEAEEASPDYLLVDGNKSPVTLLPHSCIIKGDNRSASIAAASILAKVYRDQQMITLHDQYPVYGWKSNVGYPTREHFRGLKKFGYTRHHRMSFRLRTNKRYAGETLSETEDTK